MASTQSDFVNIELSAAGLAMAGKNGAVRVTNRHMNYLVTAGSNTRVLTSEWSRVLSQQKVGDAQIFQIVPAAAPAPVSSSPAPAPTPAPAAAPKTPIAPSAPGGK